VTISRTAIVDDDGTGTTGTVLGNAWKQELYDQIDSADAAAAVVRVPSPLTNHGVVLGQGTSPVAATAAGTAGQPLLSGGSSADPAYGLLLPAAGGAGATTIALTDGATPALDASLGTIFRLSAGGDRTIAVPTNPTSGQKIVIQHYASGGARTLALNSGTGGFRFGTDITALTATASGKTDYIGAIYNATDNKWDVVAVSKGY
jgi:hypothetical protein